MLTEEQQFELAYNAHESAEAAAMDALRAKLEEQSIEALSCLADPDWHWETRSGAMSEIIIDHADDILTDKLNAMLAAPYEEVAQDTATTREP